MQLTGIKQMCIIQVYSPRSEYDNEEVEQMYEEINTMIKQNKRQDRRMSTQRRIIMGRFMSWRRKQKRGHTS